MFSLTSKMTNEVSVGDYIYTLDLSFNNVIDALEILQDTQLTFYDRLFVTFSYLAEDEIEDDEFTRAELQEAVEKSLSLINSESKEVQEIGLDGKPINKRRVAHEEDAEDEEEKKLISFKEDAKYIFAAFLQTYRIDLIEQQDKLPWVKFIALVNALPDDTLMRQIIDIRNTNLREIKDKKEKEHMKKLKEQFKLSGDTVNLEEEGDMTDE